MLDFSDRLSASSASSPTPPRKRLGGYLVEAGLLTPAQIDVALNDQKLTGMRFGEILATRGWVKQQTIEYLMQKVILPEQQAWQSSQPSQAMGRVPNSCGQPELKAAPIKADEDDSTEAMKQANRRDLPIAKPLPSLPASDGDVSWVG